MSSNKTAALSESIGVAIAVWAISNLFNSLTNESEINSLLNLS